jgi:hypothetical protein
MHHPRLLALDCSHADSRMDKRRKGVFGPPPGKRCVVFVDDLNLPARETYGAQLPLELLRQWLDHGGWCVRLSQPLARCSQGIHMPRVWGCDVMPLGRRVCAIDGLACSGACQRYAMLESPPPGRYERKPPCAFRTIVDTTLAAAMGPPGGGRSALSARTLRHWSVLAFTDVSDAAAGVIFGSMLAAFAARRLAPDLAQAVQPVRGRH